MKFQGSCVPARLSLAFLCATGVMELYMTRINLSIAIVAMVEIVNSESGVESAIKEPYCLRDEVAFNGTSSQETLKTEYKVINDSMYSTVSPESSSIKMTSTERGNILSAFFYSYFLSAIIGGRLAELHGTKLVFALAGLVDGIGNLLVPTAAKTNFLFLFFIRFIIGFFQGTCYPSLHALQAKWIPPDEVSRFVAFVYMANSIGTIFTLSTCGFIISAYGWEVVFYVSGCLSLLWTILWLLLMHDTPEQHPRISSEEKKYILEALESHNGSPKLKPKKVPWFKMLLSLPLWAIIIAHAGNMFGLSFYVTQLPIYMSSIIGINIRNNGILSSIPFLARFLASNAFSWSSAYLMKLFPLTPKKWKIILTVFGFGGSGISLLLVGYSGCSATATLIFFTAGFALNGANSSGYLVNYIDITPNFAGTALGIANTFAFLYAMIGPVLIGALTPEETLSEWVIIYWICFINFMATGLIYCFFMSTDVQPWNNVQEEEIEKRKREIKPNEHNEREKIDLENK